MISTPNGVRYLQGHERIAFLHAAKSLYRFISSNITAEKNGDVPRFRMKGEGPFIKLSPQNQIAALAEICRTLVDPHQYVSTQINYSAAECVYAWMLHEVKSEQEKKEQGRSSTWRMSSNAYSAWSSICNDFKFQGRETDITLWEKAVDELAAKVIFDKVDALQLGTTAYTEDQIAKAIEYLENLN